MRKILTLAGICAVLAAPPTQAHGAVTQSIDFTAKYVRADKHKARGGLTLRTAFKISDDTGAKPPPLRHVSFRFPKGSIANTGFFKRCAAAALERKGPSACPRDSKIGSGAATADARPVVSDPIGAKLTLFNGERLNGNPTILIYAVPELSGPLTMRAELKADRRGPYGYKLEFDIPPVPTLPGQPYASVLSSDVTTLDRTVMRNGRKRHFIEGPILCDGTYFLLDGAFTYEGGLTNSVLERFNCIGGPRCP
jgi:hypothetical protein